MFKSKRMETSIMTKTELEIEELGVAIQFTIIAIVNSEKTTGDKKRLIESIDKQIKATVSDFNNNLGEFGIEIRGE